MPGILVINELILAQPFGGMHCKINWSFRCESPPAESPKRQVGCQLRATWMVQAHPVACSWNTQPVATVLFCLLTHAMFSAHWLWRPSDLWASLVTGGSCKIQEPGYRNNSVLGGVGVTCDEAPLHSWNNPCLTLAVLQCKSLQCLRLAFL